MLVHVSEADGVLIDLRYATAANLTGKPIYQRPVAMLTEAARDRLFAARDRVAMLGLCIRVFDAFRPLDAQWALWRALPDPDFVADPAGGLTMHPRGVAIDVTLTDPASGADLDMGTGFDAMSPASAHAASGLPPQVMRNRALLLGTMVAVGWEHIATEWWHYQLPDAAGLPQLWARDVPDGPMLPA